MSISLCRLYQVLIFIDLCPRSNVQFLRLQQQIRRQHDDRWEPKELGIEDGLELGFGDGLEVGFGDGLALRIRDGLELEICDGLELGFGDGLELGIVDG